MKIINPWLNWWWAWAFPAALVVVNLGWLFGGRAAVVGRGSRLARQVGQVEADVATLERRDRDFADAEQRLATLRESLTTLRRDSLGSMHDGLVPFITDVVVRAQEAGLRPERVGYGVKKDDKTGLTYFTASYEVKGSYEQIRACVRSLESSPRFVVLENLALRSQDPSASLDVGVKLAIGTYFADLDETLIRQIGAVEVSHGE